MQHGIIRKIALKSWRGDWRFTTVAMMFFWVIGPAEAFRSPDVFDDLAAGFALVVFTAGYVYALASDVKSEEGARTGRQTQ